MNMSENVIADNLLKAMKTVVDKEISDANFDRTIEATIIDNSFADKGVYTIFYGTAQWEAYTKDISFQVGDVVQVLLPGNDTRRTKTILGKVSNKDQAVSLNQPFDRFINVSGNLVDTILKSNAKLLANGDIETALLWEYVGNMDLSPYTTVGIEADFRSLVGNAVEGEYGLLLQITGAGSLNFLEFKLDTEDMMGNPYDYSVAVKHQKLFDISPYNFSSIEGIKLYFYQTKNSFKDIDGNYIKAKDSFGNYLNTNLFVDTNTLQIAFGFLLDEKIPGQDEVRIAPAPGYDKNFDFESSTAVVDLSWIYWNDEKTRILPKEEIISTINYKIEWYYFRLQSQVIKEIQEAYREKTGQFIDLSDEDADLLYNKLVSSTGCSYINNNNWQRIPEFDNQFSCIINFSKVNSESEYKIRAFAFRNKDDSAPLMSDLLTFENTSKTLDTSDGVQSGVKIVAMDGSYGNYFCYTGTGILNNADKVTRVLQAKLYDINGEEIDISPDEDSNRTFSIKWTVPTSGTMINIRKGSSDAELIYTISNIYDITKTNNTVICTIRETYIDGTFSEYTGSFDFNFGQSGNVFGNNVLKIDYLKLLVSEQNIFYTRNAVTAGDKETYFIIRMFNSSNVEINLNELGYDISWILRTYMADETGSFVELTEGLTYTVEGSGQVAKVEIDDEDGFSLNKIYTITAIVTSNTGDTSTVVYPIAVSKNLRDYNHITGCTSVVYRQLGSIIYEPNPYKIYAYNKLDEPYTNVSWELLGPTGTNAQIKYENGVIKPNGAYLKEDVGEDRYCYGIRCLDENNEVLWIQAIIISQNTFQSSTVNSWDGHSVDINEDEGTVAAVMMATGKKNSKGEFTGVLIGDIEKDTGEYGIETGIYGFKEGDSVYALKDNGTAYLGKAGHGRIFIDGNESTITSAGYEAGHGLLLDLDDTLFNAKNGNYYVTIDVTDSNLKASDKALKIGAGADPNFSVDWGGNLRAINAYFEGTIESQAGHIANWEIKENELKSGNMIINSSTGINFNGVFTVDASGKINATGGKIGGWNISSNSLSSGNMTISSSNGINFNSVFTVDSSGNLTATEATIEGSVTADILIANTSGQIGGWNISADGLTNGIFELTDSKIKFGSNFIVSANGQLDVTNLNVLGTLQIAAGVNGRINNFIKIVKFNKRYTIGKNKYKKDLTIAASIDTGYVPIAISRITTGSSYVRPFHFGVKYSYGDSSSGGTADIVIKVSKYPRKKKVSNRQLNVWILLIKGSGPQLLDLLDSDSEPDADQPEIEDFDGGDTEADPADGDDIVGSAGVSAIKIDSGGQDTDDIVLTRGSSYNKLYHIPGRTLSWLETTVFNNGRTAGYNTGYGDGYSVGYSAGYSAGVSAASSGGKN